MRYFILAIALLLGTTQAHATEAGWALMRNGGQVVLIRNARAPGTGDPANFDIANCSTQRKLSERGRLQAREMGALIQARAAPVAKVLTSRYCRAGDTAVQAFGVDIVEFFPALDLLPEDEELADAQKAEMIERIEEYTGAGNLIMITHEANIRALVGAGAREGEAVIVSLGADNLSVAGRIRFN